MWPMLLHIFRMYVSIESNMHLNFQIAVLQLTIQSNMHLIFAIAAVQLKTLCLGMATGPDPRSPIPDGDFIH